MRTFCNRLLCAVVLIVTAVSCAREDAGSGGGVSGGDINKQVDAYMLSRYLWNDEYKQTQRNFSLAYDQFLMQTLLAMQTNTLDKKPAGDGKYTLYSRIERKDAVTKAMDTRGVAHSVKREAESSYGFANMTAITYVDQNNQPTGRYALAVSGVFADSPASKAGIVRGTIFDKVSGQEITKSNMNTLYRSLVAPGQGASCSLTGSGTSPKTYSLTAEQMFTNPILYSGIITEGVDRIGYLVYQRFDAGYDDDLLVEIGKFRDAGVTDLVLDLRLNGGGHVISAQMLSSCVAGAVCDGKVFEYYRYNDLRMANTSTTSRETGNDYDSTKKLFYTNFIYGNYYGVDLRPYMLSLPRLYVIVSGSTASASELVINSLRGIDIPVVLIGSKTEGKNVGMEPKKLKDNSFNYELTPITFQSYNAKTETVNPAGIVSDNAVSDWNGGYVNFGDTKDPCLAKALSLITGKTFAPAAAPFAGVSRIRIADDIALPAIPGQLRGTIQLPPVQSE